LSTLISKARARVNAMRPQVRPPLIPTKVRRHGHRALIAAGPQPHVHFIEPPLRSSRSGPRWLLRQPRIIGRLRQRLASIGSATFASCS
jgi:hypothetical protein